MGLTATVAQGLADAGPTMGSSTGAGGGYWWSTAKAVGALLMAMDTREGGRGRARKEKIGMKMDGPPPSHFYKSVGQLIGLWKPKSHFKLNFAIIAKF